MPKLSEYLARRSPVGTVGIEVEVEFNSIGYDRDIHVPNWVTTSDGSLSYGREFVSRQPFKVDKTLLKNKLEPLFAALNGKIKHVDYHTSTHVHVNALNHTPVQLINTMTLWWLLEDLYLDECGEERKTNRYTNRLVSSTSYFNNVLQQIMSTQLFTAHGGIHDRYNALNLASLPKHGTLEYRGMRGLYSALPVYDWVCTLDRLQNVKAKEFNDPIQVLDKYINSSNKKKWMKDIVGPQFHTEITDEHVNNADDAALTLYELAYCIGSKNTWQAWEKQLAKDLLKKSEDLVTSTVPVPSSMTSVQEQINNLQVVTSSSITEENVIRREESLFGSVFQTWSTTNPR